MAAISERFARNGANNLGSGQPRMSEVLRDVADDLDAVFTAFDAVLAKLDADAGVTDVNYASLHAVGTPTTTKS